MKKMLVVAACLIGVALLVAALVVLKGGARQIFGLRLPTVGSARLTTSEHFLGTAFREMPGLTVSPDARRVAWYRWSPDKSAVIIDGVVGEEYEYVNYLTWSPDSSRLAYSASRGRDYFVVVGRARFGPYSKAMGPIAFSPDGKHVACFACGASGCFVVVDGREGAGKYSDSWSSTLTFSPDGRRIAYVVGSGAFYHQCRVVVERVDSIEDAGKREATEGNTHEGVKNLLFSPDSKRFAYIAELDRRRTWAAIIDGAEGKRYGDVDGLVFSPDSKRIAYTALGHVVLDGVEGKEYSGVETLTPLVFSPDSQRLAYVAYRAPQNSLPVLVIGKEEFTEYDLFRIGKGFFSPDGKRTAYVARRGNQEFVVVDGGRGKPYESTIMTPVFSPNSQRVAFLAERKGKLVVVVDGVESKEEYDRRFFLWHLVFDSANLVRAVLQRGDQILGVKIKIE